MIAASDSVVLKLWFAWMVGLGESAEIIEPVDVRRQMVKHLQKMLEVHKEKST